MLVAKIVHILGIVVWLGGGAVTALIMMLLASQAAETRAQAAVAARRLTLTMVTPGMLAAWGGGLVMLLTNWSTIYAKAPWMHTKLLIGLIAAGITGVLTGRLRRAASGEKEVAPGAMKLVASILLVSAIAGVALVLARPGS